jgi:cytidylate kinase
VFKYLDTGAIYRSIALLILEENISIFNINKIEKLCKNIEIDMFFNNKNEFKIYCNKKDVTKLIRTEKISKYSSIISSYPEVRKQLLNLQRDFGKRNNIIAEGRDTGSVVFPYADYKFYFDADLETRVERRFLQLGGDIIFEELKQEVYERDERDKNRDISPLIIPENAIIIDTTNKNIKEVFDLCMNYLNNLI